MHFQIYIPGVHGADPEHIARAGLGDLRENAHFVAAADGPDGRGGMVVSWPRSTAEPRGYRPEEQTWLPAVPQGERPARRYWVGVWNDDPPAPDDLRRGSHLEGYYVALGDGNEWAVPVARWLPGPIRLDPETGAKTQEIDAAYRDFFERSQRWYRMLFDADPEADQILVPEDYWDYCVDALRLNYRLPQELVAHLGLITTVNWWAIVLTTLEGGSIREASEEKKSTNGSVTPGTSSTAPGETDS